MTYDPTAREIANLLEFTRVVGNYAMPKCVYPKCHVGIVFGTRHGISEFADDIMQLWHTDMFQALILTGGLTTGLTEPESYVMKKELVQRGFPEKKLVLETKSTHSGENVEFAIPLLEKIGLFTKEKIQDPRILGISKLSSKKRHLMTLQHWLPQVTCYIHGVNYFNTPQEKWYTNHEFRERVFREFFITRHYVKTGILSKKQT